MPKRYIRTTRITSSFTEDTAARLNKIAEQEGISISKVIERAVKLHILIYNAIKEGKKVTIDGVEIQFLF